MLEIVLWQAACKVRVCTPVLSLTPGILILYKSCEPCEKETGGMSEGKDEAQLVDAMTGLLTTRSPRFDPELDAQWQI